MEFSVGDMLQVDGDLYEIIGKIRYRKIEDNLYWTEYCMRQRPSGKERWLSIDVVNNEYSISQFARNPSMGGYHQVDSGTEEVVGVWGKVDVSIGDRATFYEYEDVTEEKIISQEVWDDEQEYCTGYYLDSDEIVKCSNTMGNNSSMGYSQNTYSGGGRNYQSASNPKKGSALKSMIAVLIPIIIVCGLMAVYTNKDKNAIAKHLKSGTYYTYVTSITGNEEQKADVYKSLLSLDGTARDIIDAINGKTESVQQNTEDGDDSIAILTKNEYCLIYTSEDNEVLVQISSRKYAYVSDHRPYHCHHRTYRYYRRYYYSRGYTSDSGNYKKYRTSYSDYDDTTIDSNSSDTYSGYASSVRQSSTSTRTSSGGGLSSGK